MHEIEQNIVICQWRADQLFTDADYQTLQKGADQFFADLVIRHYNKEHSTYTQQAFQKCLFTKKNTYLSNTVEIR